MRKVLLSMILVSVFVTAGAQSVFTTGKLKEAATSSQMGGGLFCDSIVVKDYNGKIVGKIVNGYDQNGNMINRIKYTWNDLGSSYTPDERYDYTYDDHNYQNQSVYSVWDITSKAWKNDEKVACTFNVNGKILSQDTFKWKESAWAPTFKAVATYDDRDNLLSEYTMLRDEAGQNWLALSKNEYTYNSLNQWLLAVSYNGKENTDEYVLAFRTNYTYTESGKMTLRHMEDWSVEENKWKDATKETWSYDEAENEIGSSSFFKDFETGELKETTKREKQYEGKNMILDLFYNKDTEGNWRVNSKTEYAYNEKDSVTQKISYNRDMMSGELLPTLKLENAYDANGNRLSSISCFWNNEWINSSKEEKTYNQANQLLTVRKYLWNIDFETSQGEWSMNFKEDYTYDAKGYQTLYVSYTYNQIGGVWTGQVKSEKEFDEFGNIRKDIAYQWVEEDDDFKRFSITEYFYSLPISGIIVNRTAVSIFVHDRIIEVNTENAEGIRLFDLNGRLLSKGNKVIPVSQAGCYVIAIDGVEVRKVMVD